jgi:LPS sulfotransferase NodH
LTPFVVYASPRSGSSWLVDLLDSHPRIAAYAELFLPGDRSHPSYGSLDLPRFEATLQPRFRVSLVPARLAYLRRVLARRPGIDAVGFKVMYHHPEVHPGLMPYLALRRARAVHLIRENALEQVVSWETSIARGSFRAYAGDIVPRVAVRVEPDVVLNRLDELERDVAYARRTLARYRLPTLEVAYELLCDSPRAELGRIAAFLGLEPREWEPRSTLVRMNVGTLRATVENLDEVEPALARTGRAWMLG